MKFKSLIDNSKVILENLNSYINCSFEKTDALVNLIKDFNKIILQLEEKIVLSINNFKNIIEKDNFEQKEIFLNYLNFADNLKSCFDKDFKKYKNMDENFLVPFENELYDIKFENKKNYSIIKEDLNSLIKFKESKKISSKNYYLNTYDYRNFERDFNKKFNESTSTNTSNKDYYFDEEMIKITELKINSEESKNIYKNKLDLFNNQLKQFLNIFKKNLELINKNEKLRFSIIINRTKQFIDFQKNNSLNKIKKENIENLSNKSKFNLFNSLKVISNRNINFDDIPYIKFVNYDKYLFNKKFKKIDNEFIIIKESKLISEEDKKLIQNFISIILKIENCKEKLILNKIYSDFDNCIYFLKKLNKYIDNNLINLDYENFYILVKIYSNIIQNINIQNIDYFKILYFIIKIGTKINLKNEKNKNNLLIENFIKNYHWKNFDLWIEIFKFIINENNKGSSLKNTIINRFNVLWSNKNNGTLIENDFYTFIHKISNYLIIVQLNLDLCKEILFNISKEYNFIDENFNNFMKNFENEYIISLSDKNYLKKYKKYKNKYKDKLFWRIVIEYLSNQPKQLFKIIRLDKNNYNHFKNVICKEILILDYKEKYRYNLWKFLIDDFKNYDYQEISKIENKDIELEEIIDMDVKRSFNEYKDFDNEGLRNILKNSTKVLDNKLSYCQGMNYICGMLFFQLKDINFIFDFYVNLIEKKMKHCFDNNFNNLQIHFKILDELIYYYLPEIGEHFKRLNILSIYFSNSWFIVLFSNCFQYTKKSYLVSYIFDIFFRYGYFGIYKVILILLNFYKNEILSLDFEGVLNFLSNIINRELFVNKYYKNYKKDKKTKSKDFLESNYKNYIKEYEFIENFKKNCIKFNISKQFIKMLKIN